jgi:hypothetical protein
MYLTIAFVLAVSVVWISDSRRAQGQAGTALTIGMVFQQIRDLIKDLDNRASALLQQGNSVAAQQQMLLSGLLSGTLRQMEEAYATQMNATVDRLMGAEKDAFTNLQITLDDVKRLQASTAEDVAKITRQAHAATTEVLSRVPFANKYPVVHGLLTRDVLAEFDEHPDDIQILGFFLVDPELKEDPELWIDGTKLTSGVSSLFDRIQIQLPSALKDRLKFANTACEPRQTFNLWMRVFYNKRRGLWPATWPQRAFFDKNLTASPGEIQFEITILKSGITNTTGPVDEAFRVESPNFNWGCEQNASNHADFNVPVGHTIIEKSAGWADLGGRWENHGCSVSDTGGKVVGECHVRGGNKTCFLGACDCPGGGHGRVAAWGKTRHNVIAQTAFNNELVAKAVMRGAERYDTVAIGPNQAINSIKMEVRRLNAKGRCETLADEAIVNLDPKLKNTKRATTKKAMFDISTDGSQVTIRRH